MSIEIGTNYYDEAVKKLDAVDVAKLGRYEKVICEPVRQALKDFCDQNLEFAQAVAQGGDFYDCLKDCVHEQGSAISDLEVYKRAVQFFFKGADVHMKLTIDLGDGGFSSGSKAIGLSLDNLLDF